jgi:UDP-glucose 6-dehydrogenase
VQDPIRNCCGWALRARISSTGVGAEHESARKVIAELYRPLYLNQSPLPQQSPGGAGLIRYAANTFPATKIPNEIAEPQKSA